MATVGNPLAGQSSLPVQPNGFDVDGARQSGYSDDDILGHLTSSRKFDVDGAVKSGYSKSDIIQYLSTKQTTPSSQVDSAQVRNKPDYAAISQQMAANPPGVPAPPAPPEPIETRLQSRPLFTQQETGIATPFLNKMGEGLGGLFSGAEKMAEPAQAFGKDVLSGNLRHIPGVPDQPIKPALTPELSKQGASGLHQAVGGAMGLATPLMMGAAGAAPLKTAATIAGFSAAQHGTEAGLKAMGLGPEYAEVAGDLVGLLAGAAAHRLQAPELAQLKASLLHRMADKVASEPPEQQYTSTGESVPMEPPPPSKTKTISPQTPNPPTAAAATVPESPQTTAIQIQQLQQGVRRVVMFPKGQGQPIDAPPGNIGLTHDKFGNTYWYRTDLMEPGEIHRAAENNELPQLLGGPEGLGAPDKSAMPTGGPVVVAKGPTGTEVQATATTPEQLPQTVAAHEQVTPPGGNVEVTGPKEVIQGRTTGTAPEAESSGELFRGDWNVQPNERGLQQQEHAAQATAGQVDRITGGTKDRHLMMMQSVAGTNPQAGAPVPNRAFDPMHMGIFEGEPVKLNIDAVNDRITNHFGEPIPGTGKFSGSPGEVPQAWYSRLINGISREMATWKPGQKTLIVTSGRDIQAVRACAAAGFKGEPDLGVLTSDWRTKPGELLHLDPTTGKLTDVTEPKEGINFLRHGETDANAGGTPAKADDKAGPTVAAAPQPAARPAPSPIGAPEPIRMSAPPREQPPPAAIGEPEPITAGPVTSFVKSEEGSFNPQFLKDAMEEPRELLSRRQRMIAYFKSKLPTAMEKKDAELARRYWTGQRDWWVTRVNQQIDSIRKTLTPDEQNALTFYREFRKKPGELVQFLTNSHPDLKGVGRKGIEDVKPAIRLAMKPTQAMLDADKRYSDLMEIHLLLGKKLGIFDSSVSPEEYVHRMFVPKSKADYGKLWERAAGVLTGGKQKRSMSSAKQRSYDSILQGIADGAVPRSINALDLATLYADEYADRRATKLWETAVKAGGMGEWSVGQPEDGSVKYAGPSDKWRNDFIVAGRTTGEPEIMKQSFWVPEVLNDTMKPVWKPDYTVESPLFRNLQQYQGRLKGINLAFSAFHPKALEMMVLSDMRNPKAAYDWINVDFGDDKWQRTEADAAMAGMPTSIQGRVVDAYRSLEPGQIPTLFDVATKLPVLKQINEASEAITRQIFDVMQRKMKVWFYANMRDRWIAEHPKASVAETADAKASIARFANAKFGGLNWTNLGWTKTQLSIARFGLLAPDWFWSNVESAKIPFEGGIGKTLKGIAHQATFGKAGEESSAGSQGARRFWIQGLLAAGIATQILSYVLTGKHSPEFTRVYEGEEGNKRKMRNWFFTGAPGELVNVLNSVNDRGGAEGLAKWALGKTNAIPRTAIQSAYGETYAGKKINQPAMNPLAKTIRSTGYAARSLSPIPFSVQNAWDLPQKFEPVETLKQVLAGRPAANVKIDKGNPKEGEPFWQQVMTGKASAGAKNTERAQALADVEAGKPTDAVKRGLITNADRLRAERKGKMSPLEKHVKYSSAQAALRIYDQAQPAERKQIEALVRSKVQKARVKGWEWTDQSAELAKKHFGVVVQRVGAPEPIKAR